MSLRVALSHLFSFWFMKISFADTHWYGLTIGPRSLSDHGTFHPISVGMVMTVPPYGLPLLAFPGEEETTAYSFKNTQSLECGTKEHQHSNLPSLFSASHYIYSKHTSCSIQELKPWQLGQIQTMLFTNIWKTSLIQCTCQAGNEQEEEKCRGRGSHFLFFFYLCLENHLLSGIWCHARSLLHRRAQSKLD